MIRELKTLMAVAREGTFAAAGQRIGLTQAAVSAQMQRLESELGFDLFDRTGRSARLNAMGHETLARAEEIVRLAEGLGSRRGGDPQPAQVTLGAIASAQRSVLPRVLAKFHRQSPACRTRIVPGVSMHLQDLVDAGEIEMALIIRPPFALQGDLHWTTLAHEPFRLVVPKALRGRDWKEILATQPFIRYDRGSFGGRQVDRFLRSVHITPNEVSELDELEAILELVAHEVGVALLPRTKAQKGWPAGVRAVDLGEHTFHRDIGLVHRALHQLSEPARMLVKMIGAAYGHATAV
jgi:DNA-binding transcriptional LysR family regulator